ncbi:MAG TPA: RDD family protein [Candidatus Binatia bacterium]|nr:RDD family protein [Candidatus Binatia bacterium]
MNESVSIATPDHVNLEFELAGPGSRFSAYAIDFLLNILLIIVIGVLAFLSGGLTLLRSLVTTVDANTGWGASWASALLLFIIFLITWGYYIFFEGLRQGSTPGKKLVGIRVIRQDGLPIGLREATLRNLVRAADMLPPPCYILGGLVMHFDPQGRRLGDMVAGTYVVVEKFDLAAQGASGAAWATRVEQGRSRQALTLPRGVLSAQQIGLIEQFLARRHELSQDRRAALVWQITEPLLPLLGEDRDRFARSVDLTENCERLLLQIVQLSQTKEPIVSAAKTVQPPTLF